MSDDRPQDATFAPLTIAAQGSYAAGGEIRRDPGTFDPHLFFGAAGGENRGGHAYVRYQRPAKARALPLVLWHGGNQFMRTWETTPDGREGYDTLMLRRDWEVHLVDQPGRGGAAHGNEDEPPSVYNPFVKSLWQVFRLGIYPEFFPGVQFARTEAAIDQYWRQRADDLAPKDPQVVLAALSAVFDRVGPHVLLTHSASGRLGLLAASRNANVRGIVSYEPAAFMFPQGYTPRPVETGDPLVEAFTASDQVPDDQFEALTRFPIQLIYGDNIPVAPSPYAGLDFWRVAMARAGEFRDLVNSRGGDVTILHLPTVGLHGNTHFPFSDLNNLAVADELTAWLASRGLDRYP